MSDDFDQKIQDLEKAEELVEEANHLCKAHGYHHALTEALRTVTEILNATYVQQARLARGRRGGVE